jgi:hypothetical protein
MACAGAGAMPPRWTRAKRIEAATNLLAHHESCDVIADTVEGVDPRRPLFVQIIDRDQRRPDVAERRPPHVLFYPCSATTLADAMPSQCDAQADISNILLAKKSPLR